MRLGIDVGGSYIKVVSLGENGQVLSRVMERSRDIAETVSALAGRAANMAGEEPESVHITGVGSGVAPAGILGVAASRVGEFQAIAAGALYETGISEAVVISMGTGSAIVRAGEGFSRHLGGSGVGGGTIEGLSRALFGTDDFLKIDELSAAGSLKNVDLLIEDVAAEEIPGLPGNTTAANLARLQAGGAPRDLAAGILNLVFQTVGTLGVFACRELGLGDVIVTGSVAEFTMAPDLLAGLTGLYGTRFTIPPYPAFRTAMGAALQAGERPGKEN